METRSCTMCSMVKPASEFTRRGTHRPGKLVSECTPCRVQRNRKYRITNREQRLAVERKCKFKRQYGITPEDYASMLSAQGGGCGICGAKVPSTRTLYFAVDHCHKSGIVRGLLCTKCNRGLGLFNDDVARMVRAVEYLKGELP